MLQMRKAIGAGPSPQWIFSNVFQIENFWDEYRQGREFDLINSEAIMQAQLAHILQEVDVASADDEGLGIDDLISQYADRIPPSVLQVLVEEGQRAQGGGMGTNGAGAAALQGAVRAGSPMQSAAGGPQPQEVL